MHQTLELMEIGCIAIFVAYNFVLYSQLRKVHYFYLGLLSFFVFLRALLVDDGSMIFLSFFPGTSLDLMRKIEFFSSYASVPLSVLFTYTIYPFERIKRWVNAFMILCLLLQVFVLLTPYKIFYHSLPVYMILVLVSYAIMFTIFIRAIRREEVGAMFVFTGSVLCFLFVMAELLVIMNVIYINLGPNLVNTGFVIFIFFQSVALSEIFANSMKENIALNENLEKHVQLKTKALHRSNLLRDTLIRIVSHDIRGPLSNLKSTSTLFQEGEIDIAQAKVFFNTIDKGVDHAVRMLDELMEWGKSVSDNKQLIRENISLESAITPAMEQLTAQIESKDQQFTVTGDQSILCHFHASALKVIVRNLISNAIKFTEQGGSVEVFISKEKEQVIFEVRDTGIGIPDDMKAHLFELNKDHKRPGTANEKSSGVGLFICQDLMEQNNGSLTVWDNPVGKGTIFKCTFPKPV